MTGKKPNVFLSGYVARWSGLDKLGGDALTNALGFAPGSLAAGFDV